jgi:hypothetical protein
MGVDSSTLGVRRRGAPPFFAVAFAVVLAVAVDAAFGEAFFRGLAGLLLDGGFDSLT